MIRRVGYSKSNSKIDGGHIRRECCLKIEGKEKRKKQKEANRAKRRMKERPTREKSVSAWVQGREREKEKM